MEFLLEIFFDFLLQLIGELLIEVGLRRLGQFDWAQEAFSTILALFMYFGLGAIIGILSLLIFPYAFVRSTRLHGINLIITPLLVGLTMAGLGRIRRRQGQAIMRLDVFGYAFAFAFGMALMRFLLTI